MKKKKRYKPYDACLSEANMQQVREKYGREQEKYWKKIKSVKIMHVNDFYRVFLRFEESGPLFELKGVTQEEVDKYEYLGCNLFRA